MKQKIKNALKQKFSNYGLSDDVIDGVADILVPNVKEDAEIDTAVAGCEPLLRTVQSTVDRERQSRSDAEKRAKKLEEQVKEVTEQETGKEEPEEPEDASDSNDALDSIREALATLSKQVAGMTEENIQKTQLEHLTNTLNESKVPESYYKPILSGRSFGGDFDVTAYAKEITDGWTQFEAELAGKRFEGVTPPDRGRSEPPKKQDPLAKLISEGTKELINNK